MLDKIFKGNSRAFAYLIILALVVLLEIPVFQNKTSGFSQLDQGFLYFLFLELSPLVLKILAGFLLFIQAILINELFNKIRFLGQKNYYFGFAFLLLMAQKTEWLVFNPVLLVNCLIIWLLYDLTNLYLSNQTQRVQFDIGLKLSLCYLCYYPSLILLPIFLLAMGIMGRLGFKGILIVLSGIFIPFYFLGSFYFLIDDFSTFSQGILPQFNNLKIIFTDLTTSNLTYLILFGCLSLIGLFIIPSVFGFAIVKIRAFVQVFVFMLIFQLLASFYYPCNNWLLLASAIPILAFFIGILYFQIKKQWLLGILLFGQLFLLTYMMYA